MWTALTVIEVGVTTCSLRTTRNRSPLSGLVPSIVVFGAGLADSGWEGLLPTLRVAPVSVVDPVELDSLDVHVAETSAASKKPIGRLEPRRALTIATVAVLVEDPTGPG